MELKPSEIFFSQAEINNVFDRRSCHRNKNLGETLDELVEGRCRISAIPTISVVWRNGSWNVWSNARYLTMPSAAGRSSRVKPYSSAAICRI
jgi:hypothetical protein